jgi:hypothetical protein
VALDWFGPLERGKAPWPGRTTRTDAEGWYRFDDLPEGFYTAAPGFPPDDGLAFVFEIQPGLQVDLAPGAVDTLADGVVLDAFAPLAPAPRSVITTATPTLRWEALPGADSYQVLLARGHLFGLPMETTETSMTLVQPLPPGGAMRWFVYAFIDGLVVGGFENVATFTVGEAESSAGPGSTRGGPLRRPGRASATMTP